jgi:gluconokinase
METRNHFMPVALLQSQLDALEPPKDAVVLNSSLPLEKMIQQLKPHLNEQ